MNVERSNRPKSVLIRENITKVHKIVLGQKVVCTTLKLRFKYEEVIAETEAYFQSKDESLYKQGIEKLEKRRNECIVWYGQVG